MLDTVGQLIVFAYLASLLVIGYFAHRASKESSLKDYYLAGGSLGLLSLFFTLYATQYSGNALFTIPGKAYREGIMGFAVMVAMMGIIVVYTSFAPRLHKLAKEHQFISIGDFILWRFHSKQLLFLVNLIFLITLISYVLANLKAVGLLVEGVTGGDISFAMGIIGLCLIMAIYESLGGMRSVVWTDIIQGVILMCGCWWVFSLVMTQPEMGIISVEQLIDRSVQFDRWQTFLSLVVLISVGAAVYPQALQRIYVAKNIRTLKQSYILMFFMPMVILGPLILVSISAQQWLTPLTGADTDRVVVFVINQLVALNPGLSLIFVVYIGAAIAAIMSTIDSALLAMGSIITNDLFGGGKRSEQSLHSLGRQLTWVLMMIMALLAIFLPQSIWALMVFKFELLIQIAPAVILGIRNPRLGSQPIILGLIAGVFAAVFMKTTAFMPGQPLGIHIGLWALMINLIVVVILSYTTNRSINKSSGN